MRKGIRSIPIILATLAILPATGRAQTTTPSTSNSQLQGAAFGSCIPGFRGSAIVRLQGFQHYGCSSAPIACARGYVVDTSRSVGFDPAHNTFVYSCVVAGAIPK
jgi:hypothetical protein